MSSLAGGATEKPRISTKEKSAAAALLPAAHPTVSTEVNSLWLPAALILVVHNWGSHEKE